MEFANATNTNRESGESSTVANRPRTTVAEPMLAHRQQSRKGSFYHLLKQRRT
jgi:hypothetical protein